jgi:hypothetical protein
MMEYSHPILAKGHYQVIALSQGREYDEDKIVGYAVIDSAGVRIRHELSLDSAKAWMERLIEEDSLDPSKQTRAPELARASKPRRGRR